MVQVINAQVSISAGTGFLRGFQSEKSFFGLHGGFELPRNNDVTLYGRVGQYFARNEDQMQIATMFSPDLMAQPYSVDVNYFQSFNYTTLEGGTRYYIGNDYDNGFSGYGGSNFLLAFNTVKRDYDKQGSYNYLTFGSDGEAQIQTGMIDWEGQYQTGENEETSGRIISFALGLQGGVKYTIPGTGTVYFDISAQYAIAGVGNNETANNTNLYSPLYFIFNVGFRKDLY